MSESKDNAPVALLGTLDLSMDSETDAYEAFNSVFSGYAEVGIGRPLSWFMERLAENAGPAKDDAPGLRTAGNIKRLNKKCVAEIIGHVVQEGNVAALLACDSCYEWANKLPVTEWFTGEVSRDSHKN